MGVTLIESGDITMHVEFTPSESSLLLPAVKQKEMISVSKEGTKTLVRINSSSLGIIQECLRKAKYSLFEGWRSETESPATRFGSAMHKALEVFYKGDPEDRVLPTFEQVEGLAFGQPIPSTNNDLIYRAVASFVEEAQPLAALPETDKRSIPNGVWILHEYFKKFINDPYVAYVDAKGPFIERTFTLRWHEDDDLIVDIFGTIDFVFRNTQTGQLLPGDHKTTSALGFGGSSFFDREKPNHQYTIYMAGASRLFGIESEDFMVNVIEVKAKPKTSRGSGPSFPRQVTTRTEEDFLELNEVIMKVVRDYLNAIYEDSWPMGGVDACQKYGGCQFKRVCSSPKSVRSSVLAAQFRRDSETA